jgi:hypothetical protein
MNETNSEEIIWNKLRVLWEEEKSLEDVLCSSLSQTYGKKWDEVIDIINDGLCFDKLSFEEVIKAVKELK